MDTETPLPPMGRWTKMVPLLEFLQRSKVKDYWAGHRGSSVTDLSKIRHSSILTASKRLCCGPVQIAANGLRSEYGTPEIDNSDNGLRGAGAIWDMTDDLEGGVIRPWSTSMPRTLAFKIKKGRNPTVMEGDFCVVLTHA